VLERQADRMHSVHVSNPTLSRPEFVEMLAAKFGLSSRAGQSKASFLRELEEMITGRLAAGETTVLIVDEAQSLPLELLEEVRLLANTETNEQKLLPVILAGQPELADRLNEPNLRQLKQRVALRCELRPLNDRETAGYIAGRIAVAGGTASQVFTREAVGLIHQAAHGLPRMISVLADNALLGGFARSQRPVGSQIVQEVCRDFDLSSVNGRFVVPSVSDAFEATPSSTPPEPLASPRVLGTSVEIGSQATTVSNPGSLVTVPPTPAPGLLSVLSNKGKRFFLGN
jgi:type II secretory pathway predicted ATPase ExeA